MFYFIITFIKAILTYSELLELILIFFLNQNLWHYALKTSSFLNYVIFGTLLWQSIYKWASCQTDDNTVSVSKSKQADLKGLNTTWKCMEKLCI